MSTFQRMLEVLGAREGSRDRFIADILARSEGPSSHARRRLESRSRNAKKHRRGGDSAVQIERLEQRQVLAVSTYATAGVNGGWVTVVAESGDEVFVQQVAGSKQSLSVANNSSFLGRTVVGGPTNMALPDGTQRLLAGTDVNSLDRLVIVSGTGRKDSSILPQGYPMYSPGWTQFTLDDDGAYAYYEISGTIYLQQPDGTTTSWQISNETAPGSGRYSGVPRIISGIGTNPIEVPSGYYYPISTAINTFSYDSSNNFSIRIRWNVDQLPKECVPSLRNVTWTSDISTNRDSIQDVTYRGVGPFAPQVAREVYIPFANAAGVGLGPIIPSSFEGFLSVMGRQYQMTTGGPGAVDNSIYFDDVAQAGVNP